MINIVIVHHDKEVCHKTSLTNNQNKYEKYYRVPMIDIVIICHEQGSMSRDTTDQQKTNMKNTIEYQ